MLDRDAYLTTIETEAGRLAAAAAEAGASTPVPTCPGWTVRDLVLHQGEVHRWATAVVAGGLAKPSAVPADVAGPPPPDADLISWFDDGCARLVATLRESPDDLAAFTFLNDAPAPWLFWARRQAHETGMHRIDAESAVGRATPFDDVVAADGIDEMLTGFVTRKHMLLRSDHPMTLAVRLDDGLGSWRSAISDEPVVTERLDADAVPEADCIVSGAASDVHRALWNRLDLHALTVDGDAAVFARFGECIRIQWS